MYIIFMQNTSLSYIWKSLDYVSSEVSHPANDDLFILLVVPPSGWCSTGVAFYFVQSVR